MTTRPVTPIQELPAQVIVADDHPLFRAALRLAVERVLPTAQITEADSFEALQAAVRREPPTDLVLLDLRMPGVQGFSSLVWIRAEHPSVPVVMVSAEEDAATIHRAVDFGAAGFIPKSVGLETLTGALRAVLDGQVWIPADTAQATPVQVQDAELARRVSSLSPQQLRVLMLLADGRLNKQIGGDLNVTEATIKAHVTAILRKLGLYRRTQAAVLAQRLLKSEAVALDVTAILGDDGDSAE